MKKQGSLAKTEVTVLFNAYSKQKACTCYKPGCKSSVHNNALEFVFAFFVLYSMVLEGLLA